MGDNWKVKLDAAMPEFVRLAAGDAPLSAIVRLGEVLANSSDRERAELSRAIVNLLTPTVLSQSRFDANQALNRALRILNTGEKFTWDEIILALTIRLELQLASLVFECVGQDQVQADELDLELRQIANSIPNAETFRSALQRITQNWNIPIENRWSQGDFK